MKKHQKQLIADYFSNQLKRKHETELNQLLRNDPAARSYFRTYATMHEQLVDGEENIGDLLDFCSKKSEQTEPKYSLCKNPCLLIGAAAILMLCTYLVLHIDSSTNEATSFSTTNNKPLAVIIDQSEDMIELKREVWKQETFEFQTGGIHLRFNEAVDFIFEGPGSFEILGPKSVKVHQGKTRTIVFNESGHEFSIITPEAKYVDLGTEFCLNISNNAKDKLDVQVGEIEIFDLQTNQSLAKIQQSNNLTNASSSNWEESYFNSDSLISQPGDMGFLRWKKRMSHYAAQDDVLACFDFTVRQPESLSRETRQHVPNEWKSATGDMKSNRFLISNPARQEFTHGVLHHCAWSVGRWPNKQSLLFHHPESHVSLELKQNQKEFSLNSWIKTNRMVNSLNAFLSTKHWNKSGLFRIEFERFGKLQTYFWGEPYRSTFYNSFNSEWQMLSLVIQLDENGYHANTFINAVSCISRKLNHLPFVGKTGLYLGNGYSIKKNRFHQNFGGLIDELVLWNRALSGTEITQLYEQGIPQNQRKLFSQTSP